MAPKPLPANTKFALTAWGWSVGGQDAALENADAVIMDVDHYESEIEKMHKEGKYVICYFSVGTLEPWRGDITEENSEAWYALAVAKWEQFDEYWLDISRLSELQALIQPRIQMAKDKGCDGIEPDVIDCFTNSLCYENLANAKTQEEAKTAQLAYIKWLSEAAHSLDLSIGLKNVQTLIPLVFKDFDFAVSESCLTWQACGDYDLFLLQDKAVLAVEYNIDAASICAPCGINNVIRGDPTACEPDDLNTNRYVELKYCSGSSGICREGAWTTCYMAPSEMKYAMVAPSSTSASARAVSWIVFIPFAVVCVGVALSLWKKRREEA